MIFDHASGAIRYVVVDTGGWLHSKNFIVPADRIRASAKHSDEFEVPLSKQQVEDFPPYQQSDLESDDKWSHYENSYRAKWDTGPVMHREGTDRNITPTTQQMSGNSASAQAAAEAHGWATPPRPVAVSNRSQQSDLDAADSITERAVTAGSDSVVIDNSANGIGGRWDTFQSRLRERRKEAVSGCRTCSSEGAISRGTESADTLRKAV